VIAIILVGFAAGLIAGMLGVGGGILFVPALVLLEELTTVQAEATSLLAIIPVAIVGAWRQHSYGNIRVREGLTIGALSAVGAVVGVVIANAVPDRGLEIGFGCLLLYVAWGMARRAFAPANDDAQ
jgi:uncharacterized membrane protein YfcA